MEEYRKKSDDAPNKRRPREESLYVRGDIRPEAPYRPLSYPIYQSATFENPGLESECEYSYTRCKNPTRNALEVTVASSENGKKAFAFSSGLSAVTSVLSLLSSGDHVLMSEDIYGGTYRLMNVIFAKFGIECTLANFSESSEIKSKIKDNTRLLFTETPSNPMCRVADIELSSEIAHSAGALLCVDNTFMTPFLQKPLIHGADIVIHSGTKFLSGHNDTSAGFVVVNDDKLCEELDYISKTEGAALSPFDSWLVMRGMKTLPLRMKRHEENAKAVAEFLLSNQNVTDVYYTATHDSRSKKIMEKQARGYGSVISFRVRDEETARRMLRGAETVTFAESLGGVETLITYPITQTHATTPKSLRERLGIDECLLRISVGTEDVEDIIRDLEELMEVMG